MDEKFVNAYVVETGEKQRIPRHWLNHPTLGVPFRLTPKARAAEQRTQPESPVLPPAAPTNTDADPAPGSTTPPSTTETPAAGAKE